MGDAYASSDLISPDMYRTFAHPYEKKVVEALAPTGKPYSVHICGDTSAIVGDMGALGAQILELDWKVDMGTARQAVPDSTVLMGNINPSDPMCIGTPDQVRSCVQDVIHKTRGRGLILSSGCALGANTKPENMAALVESARLYGTREQLEELQK